MDMCLPVAHMKVEDNNNNYNNNKIPLLDTSEIMLVAPPPPPSAQTNTSSSNQMVNGHQYGGSLQATDDYAMQTDMSTTSSLNGNVSSSDIVAMDTSTFMASPQFSFGGLETSMQVANAKVLSSKDGMRITLLTCMPGLCACSIGKALSNKNQAVQVPSPPLRLSPMLQVIGSPVPAASLSHPPAILTSATSSGAMVPLSKTTIVSQIAPAGAEGSVSPVLGTTVNAAAAAIAKVNVGARRLHVTNLPFKVKDDYLRKIFEDYGTVSEAEIIYNERGSKGFGFVTMSTVEEAIKARDALSGKEIQGRKIEVNNATPRSNPGKVLTTTPNRTLLKTPESAANGIVATRTYGPSYTGNWNPNAYLTTPPVPPLPVANNTAIQLQMPMPSPIAFPMDPQQAAQGLATFTAAQISQQAQQDAYTAYYNYALSQAQQQHQAAQQQQQQQQVAAYQPCRFPSVLNSYGTYRYQPY